MHSFTQYRDLSDDNTDLDTCPFDDLDAAYLYISTDGGHVREAYLIAPDALLNLDDLLAERYRDYGIVETYPESGGSNYAAIITDGRAPNDCIVWSSYNFHVNLEDC